MKKFVAIFMFFGILSLAFGEQNSVKNVENSKKSDATIAQNHSAKPQNNAQISSKNLDKNATNQGEISSDKSQFQLQKCKNLNKFITVYGSSQMQIAPDFAVVTFSIKSEATTQQDALNAVLNLGEKIDNFLNTNAILDTNRELLSSGVDMSKEGGLLSKTTYIGYRYYKIKITNLKSYAQFVSDLVAIGGISDLTIKFDDSKILEHKKTLKDAAIKDAFTKAQDFAYAAQTSPCEAIEIEELSDKENLRELSEKDIKSAMISSGPFIIETNVKVKFGLN
jgi:hypothetical protein